MGLQAVPFLAGAVADRKAEDDFQILQLGPRRHWAYIEGVKRNQRKRPEPSGLKGKTEMFATLKRAAKALRVPTAEEVELAYIYEAGDRYDLEARERNLSRRNFNRTLGF